MEKLVDNLNVRDYDVVEDILFELLKENFGVEKIYFDTLEKDIEYVVGTINIVKKGNSPNSLKHQHYVENEYVWSEDVVATDSYKYADYYRLDKMNELCENTLSGRWSETYNFNENLNRQ